MNYPSFEVRYRQYMYQSWRWHKHAEPMNEDAATDAMYYYHAAGWQAEIVYNSKKW